MEKEALTYRRVDDDDDDGQQEDDAGGEKYNIEDLPKDRVAPSLFLLRRRLRVPRRHAVVLKEAGQLGQHGLSELGRRLPMRRLTSGRVRQVKLDGVHGRQVGRGARGQADVGCRRHWTVRDAVDCHEAVLVVDDGV